MREFLNISALVVAILTAFFGYVYFNQPQAFDARIRDAGLLMGLLDDYHAATGTYPVLNPVDVPIAQLAELLQRSGVNFRSGFRFSDLDPQARYISVTGESYGLLYHFTQFNRPVTCIVEVDIGNTGWWGGKPRCPW